MNKINLTVFLALAFAVQTALFGQGYFAEPFCGSKLYESLAPTQVASTDTTKINMPIGQGKADELAKAFGLQKDKCFTPIQFFTFITGGGYGGNLTNALMIADATLILTNTKQNPIVRSINGNATSIVLGSYGLTVNEDGQLESCAQVTSPCRTVNEILVPGGWMETWCKANGATKALENLYSSAYTTEAVYSARSQGQSGNAQLVSYNLTGGNPVKIGMSMIPPLWIVNFCLIYTLNPELAAAMPAYWTAIPQQVAADLMNSPQGQINYCYYQQYFPVQSMIDTPSGPPPMSSWRISSATDKIQNALARGSTTTRTANDVANILGVSKFQLLKAIRFAPSGVRLGNGKIHLLKLYKFISSNSRATALLSVQ